MVVSARGVLRLALSLAVVACACGGAYNSAPLTSSTSTGAGATPPVVGPQTPASAVPITGPTRQVPIPADGAAYFGVQIQWQTDSPGAYSQRLGRIPAVFGRFVSWPFTSDDRAQLDSVVAQIAALHGKFFLTLEPHQGLQAVTPAAARDLGATVAGWNAKGVDIFIRFGQEMNGSWYIWGQKPLEYVAAFRIVADAVHTYSPRGVMVWSPNYGGGYPYPGQTYLAQPGTPDFAVLDRDHDGKLTEADDPYAAYYPGDAYVDWVGLTLYHFGDAWPWGKNIVAERNKFVDQLTGHYNGANGNDTAVPDFYATYAAGHHKPMALSETAALYNQAQASRGATNTAIKVDWIHQAFDTGFAARFPLLKMENWFEYAQPENGIDGLIDWRATVDPQVLAALRAALGSRFVFAS